VRVGVRVRAGARGGVGGDPHIHQPYPPKPELEAGAEASPLRSSRCVRCSPPPSDAPPAAAAAAAAAAVTAQCRHSAQHTLEWDAPIRHEGATLEPGKCLLYTYPSGFEGEQLALLDRVLVALASTHLFEVPDGYKPDGFRYFGERMAAKEKAGARARRRSGSRDYDATNGHRPPDGRSSHGDQACRSSSPRLTEDAAITDDELWS